MTIDYEGFIIPVDSNKQDTLNYYANSQIYYKMEDINSDNFNKNKSKIKNVKKIRSKNNCWICEGWREHHFSIKKDLHKFVGEDEEEEQVLLHLSFENYRPVKIQKNQLTNDYEIYRMCPPGDTYYYYTVDGEIASNFRRNTSYIPTFDVIKSLMEEKSIYSDKDEKEEKEEKEEKGEKKNKEEKEKIKSETRTTNFGGTLTRFNSMTFLSTKNKVTATSTITNYRGETLIIPAKALCKYSTDFNRQVINEGYYSQLSYCKPRPKLEVQQLIRPPTPWSFPISLWASYYNYAYEPESEVNLAFNIYYYRNYSMRYSIMTLVGARRVT